MNPQLVRWSFNGLHVPMISLGNELFCTNRQLSVGLGAPKDRLQQAYRNHREELDSLKGVLNIPKDFLEENRVELGIERIRKDLVFWNEDAMISFAFFLRTPNALKFRKELRALIKSNRSVHTVSKIEHDQLKSDFEEFKNQVMTAMPYINKTASLAGSALQAQAATKHLRLVHG